MSNETAISPAFLKHYCSLNLTLAPLPILLFSKQIIDQIYVNGNVVFGVYYFMSFIERVSSFPVEN